MRNRTDISSYNITYTLYGNDLLYGHSSLKHHSFRRIYISYIKNNYNKLYYEK